MKIGTAMWISQRIYVTVGRSRLAQSVPLLPHYEGSVGERVPVSSPIIRGSHRRPTRGSVAVHHR